MKIAIDIRSAYKQKTGKGWYTFNIVKELLEIAPENQYLLYTNEKKNPFGKHKNCELKTIEDTNHKWHFKVLKDLKKENPDIFFAPSSYIIPALAPKPKTSKHTEKKNSPKGPSFKTIITVHDLVAFLHPHTHSTKAVLIERLTLKKALKNSSHIFVVSENTKKDLLNKFKYPENQVSITYCAPSNSFTEKISKEDLVSFKEKYKLPDNYILAVGTLEPRKNFATLIKSFVMIKKWHPEYKLVIVGKEGWKHKQVDKLIKEYKLEKDIIFPGYLKDTDLHKAYLLAKLFVFPSLYEGFGIPPLEAMATGCPVISSNRASLPEVIGEAGLLIDPNNAYKFADAISSLIDKPEIRDMLIERGFKQAEKFSWRESAQKVLQVFQETKEKADKEGPTPSTTATNSTSPQ